MYCSTCGVAVAQGLSYCNYCGAKLDRADIVVNSSDPTESLIPAMAAVFVLGMISIIVLMGVMKVVLGVSVATILAFTLLPFLLMLVLEGVFIRLLFRRTRSMESAGETVLLKGGQTTKELDTAQPRVLPEVKPSVTEHTTRTFDPLYTERK